MKKNKRILFKKMFLYCLALTFIMPGVIQGMTDLLLSSADPAASGMADAGCGLIKNGTVLNINPAGGYEMDKYEAGISYSQRYNSLDLYKVKSRIPVYNMLSLSCNLLYSGTSIKDMDKYGIQTGKESSVKTYLENIVISYQLNDNIYSGAGIKFIQDYLGEVFASYQVLDYGFICKWRFLSAGFSVLNNSLGGNILYQNDPVFIASTKRIGAGAVLLKNNLHLAADFLWDDILEERLKAGAEYRLLEHFFLRAGYDTFYGKEYEFINGFCFGFGVAWQNIKLDYSWQKAGDWLADDVLLSGMNKIGLSYIFSL